MIRVLVVDDSAVHRSLLIAILESDPAICVVGTAADGAEAVRMAQAIRPDLVTMDLQMPVLDGFEATRRIMEACPTPIVVVAAGADGDVPFRALRAGALEVVAKPSMPGSPDFGPIRDRLLTAVKLMAEVKVLRRRVGAEGRPPSDGAVRIPPATARAAPDPGRPAGVVAVAASTGGPPALAAMLRPLPSDFPLPIVVVQHMTPGFTRALVDWLGTEVALKVGVTDGREPLRPGRVVFAPEGRHLEFAARGLLRLIDGPPVSFVKPSATVLLASAARVYGPDAIGVILTGMGDDGALGLKAIRDAGGATLVQDEASCTVFGMPRVALDLGAADRALPPAALARALLDLAGSRVRAASRPGP